MSTPAAPSDDATLRLQRYLDSSGLALRRPKVTPLTGDASDRRYFRIEPAGGPSQIVAVHAGRITLSSLPFAVVGALFEAMPVRVPRILGHDEALGVITLEDLGDVTLQAALMAATPAERNTLYREAVGIITVIQRRGRDLASSDLLPYRLAFDVEKLTFELRFFTEHFLEGLRGAEISPDARHVLDDEYSGIVNELAEEPRVLCHRDYHSRNLMVHDGQLCVIDFQDARLGPNTYDLVSLLRDAYVDIGTDEVDDLVSAYLAQAQIGGQAAADFWRRFDLMAVQRLLKALGTFGFQATIRDNAKYLQDVPRVLGTLRSILIAYPRFDPLRRQLAAFLPELQ